MSERYNGWANYETWVTNLWLTNDQGDYDYLIELAHKAFDEELEGANALADWLKGYAEEQVMIGVPASLSFDLLKSALDEVDWQEIAEAFLEGLDEEVAHESN